MSGVLFISIYFLLFRVSLSCIPTQQVVTTTTVSTTTIPDACATCGSIYCTDSTGVLCEDETLIGMTYTNSADGLVCTGTATCSSTATSWFTTIASGAPLDSYGASISVTCTGSVGVWYNGADSISNAFCALY